MSACHISPLAGHSHEQRTLFRILARFGRPMINKDVDKFIKACVSFKFVNKCSYEAQQLLQTIDSGTPFNVVFIDFWEPGDIPDRYGSRKNLTCLDCMTWFGLVEDTGPKEITSDQASRWAFGNFFVPFGLPKIIVVDADGMFTGMSKKTFQENLLI